MPILWRFLILFFLKISCICVIAFVAILLTMRLDEIAHFAALGAPIHYLLFFTLYQIPYILPIALPISCLIGSFLLIQRLSISHELTALRAGGFSLPDILAPILITAAFLSIFNFWIASELATHSHLQSNLLKSELRSINPLFLLHNKHLMRLKGFYFESLGASQVGESASSVVLALPNQHHQRLSLMLAKNLKAASPVFIGNETTLITSSKGTDEEDFDHLLIENIRESVTYLEEFTTLLQKKVLTINNDYLQMPLLLAHIHEQKRNLKEWKESGEIPEKLQSLKNHINRSLSEITKRFSVALAVFTFTLMGASFAINITRQRRSFTLYLAILLTTLFLISFFLAKGLDQHIRVATTLYLVPHLIIILTSMVILRRTAQGIG